MEAATPHPEASNLVLRAPVVPWEEYRAANESIFPSVESWRWFVRQHRAALDEAGALCYLAGKVFVRPDVFARCLLEIGTRLSRARAV